MTHDALQASRPLDGVRVLDFSTLLPGPLASLVLAEAGAEVLKVERPGSGDEMRTYQPRFDDGSANHALLNRAKRSVELDLKSEAGRAAALDLAAGADIVMEQFRPGVMERLGLDYDSVRRFNAPVVYCSISGYGRSGDLIDRAGHDLNYLAETGLLSLGAAVPPPALIADVAGGAYPAVMNILLALRMREATGAGTHLDISMAVNLFPLMYWALADGLAGGAWPRSEGALVTGGSPRYRLYETSDRRHVAVAALEDRFWRRFCDLVGLPENMRDDAADPGATMAEIAGRIARRTAAEWDSTLGRADVCCSVVRSLEEATRGDLWREASANAGEVTSAERRMPALPTPLAPCWPRLPAAPAPRLGSASPKWRERAAGPCEAEACPAT